MPLCLGTGPALEDTVMSKAVCSLASSLPRVGQQMAS